MTILGRIAKVDAEMFFPGNDKLGFGAYSDTVIFGGAPEQTIWISPIEKQLILDDIEADFAKRSHTLDIE